LQDELRSLGWQFDLKHPEQVLCRYDTSTNELGERATETTLPKLTPKYTQVKAAVERYLVTRLQAEYKFTTSNLPFPEHFPENYDERARVPVYISPNAWEKPQLLCIVMGKGESRAPAWVSSVAIYVGLTVGSMFTYIQQAQQRDFGILICNPNLSHVVLDMQTQATETEDKSNQTATGPAPPELVTGIQEFGFSKVLAHRACIGSQSTNLEDCGNWIFERLVRIIRILHPHPLDT